jgi:hypothetical protein
MADRRESQDTRRMMNLRERREGERRGEKKKDGIRWKSEKDRDNFVADVHILYQARKPTRNKAACGGGRAN